MANYSLKKLDEDNYSVWDEFVSNLEFGTIFHQTKWLKKVYSGKGVDFEVVVVYDDKGQLVAGFAFGYKSIYSQRALATAPVTPYFSPLIKPKKTNSRIKQESYYNTITELIIEYLESKLSYIKITFPPEIIDIRPWDWSNYTNKVLYTYKSELKVIDDVINKFDSDIKRRAKKAKELDYILSTDTSEMQIHDFYELLQKTYKKQQHKFTLSEGVFKGIVSSIFKEESAKIYTVYYERKPVSSCLIIFDTNIAYYWLAGSDPDYLKMGFNQLLFVEMMADLSNMGKEYFDFIGANTSTIARYKGTFNMDLVPYHQVEKVSGLLKPYFKAKNIIK
jgi:lipid II:glycine glycyltransferase (peptidoglycan interpeptide bridge formation enzyme)